MAVELDDLLLVPWHEFEVLPTPEDLRAHLERHLPHVPDVELEISDDWDFAQRVRTDADGRVRLDTTVEWPHHVAITHPVTLPDPPADPRDATGTRIDRITSAPLRFSTRYPHVLVVPRPRATILGVDGWAEARAVLLFGTMRDTPDGPLTLRGALRTALADTSGGELHVVGHADTEGKAADNDALALERARSLHLYLTGDRQAWAEHAFAHADVATLQSALAWAAVTFGIACHPGDIDGDWGPSTAAALTALRDVAGIDPQQRLGPDDWAAIHELYDRDLAQLLLVDAEGLAAARARLRLAAPISMGERWPVEAPELDDHECPANRRVDLVMCTPGSTPRPETDEIYDGTFALRHLAVEPEATLRLFVHRPTLAAVADAEVDATIGSLGSRSLVANDDGVVTLTVLRGDVITIRAARPAVGDARIREVLTPELEVG